MILKRVRNLIKKNITTTNKAKYTVETDNDGFQTKQYTGRKAKRFDKSVNGNTTKLNTVNSKQSHQEHNNNSVSDEINKKGTNKVERSIKNEELKKQKEVTKIEESEETQENEETPENEETLENEETQETEEALENEDNQETKIEEKTKDLYVPPIMHSNLSSGSLTDDWTPSFSGKHRPDKMDYDNNDNLLNYHDPRNSLPGDDMKLNTIWNVWIHENDNPDWSLLSYKSIFEISSVASMWRFLWVLSNLNKNVRQYYIMRYGITPIWEDNNNKQGAICSIMIDNMVTRNSKNDFGVDAFTAICILVLNESFVKNNGDINGLCYSIKSKSVLIKLWIKNYENNTNFKEMLPITFLKTLDSVIANMENRNHVMKSGGKSRISIQLKPIKPEH